MTSIVVRLFFLLLCVHFSSAAISSLPMSQAAIVGRFSRGPVNLPLEVNEAEFMQQYASTSPAQWPSEMQARMFFRNGGTQISIVRTSAADLFAGSAESWSGVRSLEVVSDLRIVLVPDLAVSGLSLTEFTNELNTITQYAEDRKFMIILDMPTSVNTAAAALSWKNTWVPNPTPTCAVYYPAISTSFTGSTLLVSGSGSMAAKYLQNDNSLGIWKSPSGVTLPLADHTLAFVLNASERSDLGLNGICPLHQNSTEAFPFGARTLAPNDAEQKFISIVRTNGWIRKSIIRGLGYTVTSDHNSLLWNTVKADVESYLDELWTAGALLGATSSEAYFVQCGLGSTMTAQDVTEGRLIIQYGVALLRPNEFMIQSITLDAWLPNRPIPVLKNRMHVFDGYAYFDYDSAPGYSITTQLAEDLSFSGATQITFPGDGTWGRIVMPTNSATRRFFRTTYQSQR